jgi:hypothetical protein
MAPDIAHGYRTKRVRINARFADAGSDDLAGNLAPAVGRIGGHDGALQREHIEQFRHAVISFDFASVAICASTVRCSHPHALTMCNGDSNERRSTLPSIATTPSICSQKPVMNRWNAAANWAGSSWRNSRLRVSWWLGSPFVNLSKPQERLLRSRILRQVHRALPAAQHSAKRDHQKLVEITQPGVAGPWILKALPAGDKLVQHDLPAGVSPQRVESITPESGKRLSARVNGFPNTIRLPGVLLFIAALP